jgi:hypothetical protein
MQIVSQEASKVNPSRKSSTKNIQDHLKRMSYSMVKEMTMALSLITGPGNTILVLNLVTGLEHRIQDHFRRSSFSMVKEVTMALSLITGPGNTILVLNLVTGLEHRIQECNIRVVLRISPIRDTSFSSLLVSFVPTIGSFITMNKAKEGTYSLV